MDADARLRILRRANTLDNWGVALIVFGMFGMIGSVVAAAALLVEHWWVAGVAVGAGGIVQSSALIAGGLTASAVSDLLAGTARKAKSAPDRVPPGR